PGDGLELEPEQVHARYERSRAEPGADRRARARHGGVRGLSRRAGKLPGHVEHGQPGAAGRHHLYAPLGDLAAADEPEQHAHSGSRGHADRERSDSGTGARSHGPHAARRGFDARQRAHEEGAMTRSRSRRRGGREAGYSLVELLVSMGIMVTVTGGIFTLVDPGNAATQTQPEVQDMHQRMRVATDTLFKDLMMAGAGPYQGPVTGSLMGFFAPILPHCWGNACPTAAGGVTSGTAVASTISMVYIPNTYSQTTISDPMPPSSEELKVNPQPNCPDPSNNPLCGFH